MIITLHKSSREQNPKDSYGLNKYLEIISKLTGSCLMMIRMVLWTNKSASTSFKLIVKIHLISVASDLSLESTIMTMMDVSLKRKCMIFCNFFSKKKSLKILTQSKLQ